MKKCIVLLPLLFLTACGYTLVQDKGIFGGEITSVTLPMFKNKTFEPHVAGFFTNSFSRELAASGLLEINKPTADATLEGTITAVTVTPSSLSVQGLTLQKVATVYISLLMSRWSL